MSSRIATHIGDDDQESDDNDDENEDEEEEKNDDDDDDDKNDDDADDDCWIDEINNEMWQIKPAKLLDKIRLTKLR